MFSELKNAKQQPIQNIEDDKLNRRYFVSYVSNIIKDTSVEDRSFTIAINGKWGEGKTSTKNLIIEKLLHSSRRKERVILDFNSIVFQNQKDLNKVFLNSLTDVVKEKKKSDSVLNFVKNNKSPVLFIFIFAMLVIGFFYQSIFLRLPSMMFSIFFVIGVQMGKVSLSVLMDVLAKITSKIDAMRYILYYSEIGSYDYSKMKLRKYINRNCPYSKIVVFFDNFDILDTNQIKLLMQFINNNSSLNKFVFVLFYDKNIVSNLLNTNLYKGTDFIDNCVNIQLDLPPITDDILTIFVQDELQDRYNIDIGFFDSFKYIKSYFMSLNKIYTFLDSFGVNYTLAVKNLGKNNFDFNRKDFFFLEVLRFFENDLYREIRKSKRFLTRNNLKIDYNSDLFSKLLGLVKNNSEENIKHLLSDMFPYVLTHLDNNYKYDEDTLKESYGVGYFDYFNYYFNYDLNGNIIGENSFKNLFSSINNYELFTKNFTTTLLSGNKTDIYKTAESFLLKLNNRVDSVNIQSVFGTDFLKSIVWLYAYSSLRHSTRGYVVNILLECLKYNDIYRVVGTFCSILDEKDYFNYFYIIKIISFMKWSLFDMTKNKNDTDKYKEYINKVIYDYIDKIIGDKKLLDYLMGNTLDSKLQIYNIFRYINEKIAATKNNEFRHSNTVDDYIKTNKFMDFKRDIFDKYFSLLYIFCEYRMIKRYINGDIVSFINPNTLYPLEINEIIQAFKKKNINKKDKVYSALLRSKQN